MVQLEEEVYLLEDHSTEDLIYAWKKSTARDFKRKIEAVIYERNSGFMGAGAKALHFSKREDFFQHCFFFLRKAMLHYDVTQGKFSTYFVWQMRSAINIYHYNDFLVHRRRKDTQKREDLLSTDLERYSKGGGSRTVGDDLICKKYNPEKGAEKYFLTKYCHSLLDVLPERESNVIKASFGFFDDNEMTTREIGAKYEFSHEWVRESIKTGLKKIRLNIKRSEIHAKKKNP